MHSSVSELLPSPLEIQKRIAECSLYEFVKQAWSVIEPGEFVGGWHIEAVCAHLEAVSRKGREIRNLIINIPPRHTKSLVVSVLWPAWVWGPLNRASLRWLCMSYSADLSIRDSVKCRALMTSPWYRKRWGDRFGLTGDVNARERYSNVRHGYRVASSVGGMATGEGGDILVIDDPINIKDATSDACLRNVINWWDMSMPTRLNDPKRSARVIIMQRSHENDLTGHILQTADEHWDRLILPAEYDGQNHCRSSIGFSDPRTQVGELLWPERYDRKQIDQLKRELGGYAYAAQFQQRPSPQEGGIFKRFWWRFYTQRPAEFDLVLQSWDLAFKDLKTSDFVCGQVWGAKGADRYLLDEVRERLDFVGTLQAMRALSSKWPTANLKLVEDKANGPAVISQLRSEITGLVAVNPDGSKTARAYAATPEAEAGNVHLPAPEICPWIDAWLEELAQFPNGTHDDRVDAYSQAMRRFQNSQSRLNLPPIYSDTRNSVWTQQWEQRA